MHYYQFKASLHLALLFCAVVITKSSLMFHPRTNFHYVVQLPNDNELYQKTGSSDEQTGDDEGTLTSLRTSLGTPYEDCGSHADIRNLTVSPCDPDMRKGNSDICEIERGSNVTFNLSFVPKVNATQLKAVIHGVYHFIPVPFPCPQPDACHNSGIDCPLQIGRLYDYQLSATVLTSYPKIKLWIKGQLEDENGDNVICVKIHVQLV